MKATRRLTLLGIASASALLCGVLFSVAPAFAVLQYPLVRSIGTFGAFGAKSEAVAVDRENTIADMNTNVSVFNAAGESTGNLEPLHSGEDLRGLAVNESAETVYVSESFFGKVSVYSGGSTTPTSEINGAGDGTPVPKGLIWPTALAVDDATGDVYVYDRTNGVIDVFTPAGEYLFQITSIDGETIPTYGEGISLAVNETTGDLLVSRTITENKSIIYLLDATTGTYLTSWTGANTPQGTFYGTVALTVNQKNGEVLAAAKGFTIEHPVHTVKAGVVDRFASDGEYESQVAGLPGESWEGGSIPGVAVSEVSGDIYVLDGPIFVFAATPVAVPRLALAAPTKATPSGVTVVGSVNPEGSGEASCEFEYGTTLAYGQRVPCPAQIPNGSAPTTVEANVSGLKSGTTYYYRLVGKSLADGAVNLGEYGEAAGQVSLPGPTVVSASALDVSAEAASLQVGLVPNGDATSVYFEYGPSESYGSTGPAAPGIALGSGGTEVQATYRVQGLQPDTTYHYRMVAVSELSLGKKMTVYGKDQTFTTQATDSTASLMDGRQWELVSPPDKEGALIEPLGHYTLQAAANGDAIDYRTNSPSEAAPQGYAVAETALSRRTAEGWSSQDISPPHDQAAGFGGDNGIEFLRFSLDLSRVALRPTSSEFTPLSSDASESTSYLRRNFESGDAEAPCESACYTPLVTRADDTADPFVPFGEEPNGVCEQAACGPTFRGASSDLSHVILSSPAQLTSTPAPVGGEGVYEWSAGGLELVGVLPSGEAGPAILAGSSGESGFGARNSVSEDGQRVILEGGTEGGNGLYLREVGTKSTVRLDAVQGGKGPSMGLEYMAASSDGSRVFFVDAGRLTSQSSESGEDLYEYNLTAAPGDRLRDLSVDPNPKQPAEVTTVVGASEDGSYVYFIARGALVEGSQPGALNLYVRHEGATKLIASMSKQDENSFSGSMFGRVSPNGQWLAFMSATELTRYDNRDALSDTRDTEVYLYDAASGKLVCASCNPTGARPVGVEVKEGSLLVPEVGEHTRVGASVPPWTAVQSLHGVIGTFYQSRYLSNGGRLIFDSADALVPQDVNATVDVYEYEPSGYRNGEGRLECSSEDVTFSERSNGCVGLVSSGTSSAESVFLDASETGGDVFFLTRSQLVQQDYDTLYDVYDAHECTSAAPCLPAPAPAAPPCEEESSCRTPAPAQPALYGAPPSATFSGAGNVVSVSPIKSVVVKKSLKCKRGVARDKNGRCVKRKAGKSHKSRMRRQARASMRHARRPR